MSAAPRPARKSKLKQEEQSGESPDEDPSSTRFLVASSRFSPAVWRFRQENPGSPTLAGMGFNEGVFDTDTTSTYHFAVTLSGRHPKRVAQARLTVGKLARVYVAQGLKAAPKQNLRRVGPLLGICGGCFAKQLVAADARELGLSEVVLLSALIAQIESTEFTTMYAFLEDHAVHKSAYQRCGFRKLDQIGTFPFLPAGASQVVQPEAWCATDIHLRYDEY